jgi:hypothetical protein
MTLTVTYDPETGQNHYHSDGHVVFVGPHIDGHVETVDGTRYNITPLVVEVASPEHAAEVAHLIGKRFEVEGHPKHDAETPFVYTPPLEG